MLFVHGVKHPPSFSFQMADTHICLARDLFCVDHPKVRLMTAQHIKWEFDKLDVRIVNFYKEIAYRELRECYLVWRKGQLSRQGSGIRTYLWKLRHSDVDWLTDRNWHNYLVQLGDRKFWGQV